MIILQLTWCEETRKPHSKPGPESNQQPQWIPAPVNTSVEPEEENTSFKWFGRLFFALVELKWKGEVGLVMTFRLSPERLPQF